MATNERARHELYSRLEEVLGEVHTDTLMSHLPPSGWGEVATKRDLQELETRLESRFDALEARLEARLARALAVQTRVILVSVVVALVGAVLATAAIG